jgi:pimeloyl-ACP methyl ester carboxylesterase
MEFDSDGLRLHYELHGPDSGRPVALVHGFASSYRLNWVGTRWQETLAQAGFRVIGLDCRGHGRSDKPHDPAAYALDVMAADVTRLLDHLDIPSADYLGFSMGARVGLEALIDHSQRWRRAVLGGLGKLGEATRAESIARALRGGPAEDPTAERFFKFASADPGNDLEALAACILGPQPPLEAARLAGIKTPVLVVVGERDDLVHDSEELVKMLPQARLVVVAGRDHLGTVPARDFKQAAVAFLTAP